MSHGTLFRTKDGDLDLLWLMLGAHLILGWVLTLAGLRLGEKAFVVAVANNVVSILILAVIKVPIDRARLLAPALRRATATLGRPPFSGMDMNEHD